MNVKKLCTLFKISQKDLREKKFRLVLNRIKDVDKSTISISAAIAFMQFIAIYCIRSNVGNIKLSQKLLSTLKETIYDSFKGTVTLTFGDVAESHVGMQKLGTMAEHGFSLKDLKKAQTFFKTRGLATKIIHLNEFLPLTENISDKNEKKALDIARTDPKYQAYLLVVRDGVTLLTGSPKGEQLLTEVLLYKWDTKLYNTRRKIVQNKNARHNLNFSDQRQESDFEQGKGTTVAWGDVPILNKLRADLKQSLGPIGEGLKCEGNLYYKVGKTGIGYHGDTERRKVVGVRLGRKMNIHYMWYYNDFPRGLNMSIELENGDIYFMGEKTVGTDWRPNKKLGFTKKSYVLRHAAGADKYTKKTPKIWLKNSTIYKKDPEITVAVIEYRKKRGKLKRGAKVEVNFKGRGKWYKGKVDGLNQDGTYDIAFADDDSERHVPRSRVRPLDGGWLLMP